MKRITLFSVVVITAFACSKVNNPTPNPPTPDGNYNTGVLITNEGAFQGGTGTLSWYNQATKTVENNIFQTENGFPIGNILNSIYADALSNRAYLVVNNSQKIWVTKLANMEAITEISGFSSPRYFLKVAADKAYVTDWTSNTLKVIDLNSNSISNSIALGAGPDRMITVGTRVVIANSGGFGTDSTISVVNTLSDNLMATYYIGDNPNSMQLDANGALWVLCSGINDFNTPANSTPGKLVQIDLATGTINKSFEFPSSMDHPSQLQVNQAGTVLYWLSDLYSGAVYEMNISSASLPTSAKISGAFYGFNVDKTTDEIYVTDPVDYQQDGLLMRFNSSGSFIDSVRVGLIPGSIWFN